jgi:xylulokinase
VLAAGGGARSPLWRQILADVFGVPVAWLQAEDGAAFGAALLAGVGAGTWPDVDTACDHSVRVAGEVAPNPADADVMSATYARYRRLYESLAPAHRDQPLNGA